MKFFNRIRVSSATVLCASLMGLTGLADAAPCITGSLQSYTALGAAGCSVGSTQFTSFSLLPVSFTEISPTDVLLTPSGLGFLVGLNATASAGQALQSTFSFFGSGANFLTASVGLIGSSVTVDGANTALGVFAPGGNAIAFDIGIDSELTDSVSLGNATSIAAQLDFVVDGGPSGRASLQQGSVTFTAQDTAIPEPSSLLLTLSAFMGLAFIGRRNISISLRRKQ